MPSHAESAKFQKINFERESEGELTILESNTFKGIPMADYFRVDTLWCVRQAGSRAGGAVDIVVTGEVSPDHGRQTNWQTDRQRGVAVCVSPTQHVHGCIDVLSIYSVCSIVQYSIV